MKIQALQDKTMAKFQYSQEGDVFSATQLILIILFIKNEIHSIQHSEEAKKFNSLKICR